MNPCNMFPPWVQLSSQWNNQVPILWPSVLQLILETSIGLTYMYNIRTWYLKTPLSIYCTSFPLSFLWHDQSLLKSRVLTGTAKPHQENRDNQTHLYLSAPEASKYTLFSCQTHSLSNLMCLLKLGLEDKMFRAFRDYTTILQKTCSLVEIALPQMKLNNKNCL